MPQLSTSVVFALIAFAGIFLLFFGISRMRRSAGGSEDFQANAIRANTSEVDSCGIRTS